ncbi:MAG: 4-(cytidine 5'-diphospho)-2-C-methyl-D-erythritol kinase [Dehalococcoidia bacterium]|nr:4-(cytidine 5'-diphospho)-2-C-methyl-D-erythritol kinase [Dehalococcoidia bacterium]
MITIEAFAKVNLTLEVLKRRPDGFHEIRSVMQSIRLCDKLFFEPDKDLNYQCALLDWNAEESLISRAAELLARHIGTQYGAKIVLDKHIPLSSGLGGDSSDAAAVLRGLKHLWDVDIPSSELASMAAELGSDAPFFLSGGTALARGRGEVISVLPVMPYAWLVLLFPDVAVPVSKTASMYAMLRPEHFTNGTRTDALMTRLTHGAAVTSEDLFNVFDEVACDVFLGLESYRAEFERAAGVSVHLAGAGPTLFALFNEEDQAYRTQQRLQDAGMNTYLAATYNLMAQDKR